MGNSQCSLILLARDKPLMQTASLLFSLIEYNEDVREKKEKLKML